MTRETLARHAAFVLRCSGAASLSYLLGAAVGLQHPVWASISSIIVSQEKSQEKLNETNSATLWRLAGTIIGVAVTVAVGSLLIPFGANTAVQLTCAVALCAAIVRLFPALKVSMWTAPIVLLSGAPGIPLLDTGIYRGAEVLVGGLVGAALHWLAEIAVMRFLGHPITAAGPSPVLTRNNSHLSE
ncbi:MAG: FUSC family protein [Acidocella sp.]|uniref:FUSC family protein n=1 Tax=Acidocella sp. TaxID=50710 RepID=UPI003FC08485